MPNVETDSSKKAMKDERRHLALQILEASDTCSMTRLAVQRVLPTRPHFRHLKLQTGSSVTTVTDGSMPCAWT
ncbi:hypothetical protein ATANTOWER_002180 [Ataeniobius toweri]|uniref:Uncharacterized protein n=1 Tax=Ataeniobius toweri TaxID=208326 RepID=A0ABU7AAE4_9TELE|nr:hypothetical protein [Ataeniobius toweri]